MIIASWVIILPSRYDGESYRPTFICEVMAPDENAAWDRLIGSDYFRRVRIGKHDAAIFQGGLGKQTQLNSNVRVVRL